MLFKYETVVWVVCAFFLALPSAFAADTSSNIVNNQSNVQAETKQCMDLSHQSYDACHTQVLNDQKNLATTGRNGDTCEKANDEFTKAKGDFEGACPIANLPGDAAECAKAIKDCGKKRNNPTRSSSRDSKICPAQGAGLDKLREEVQKVQESVATKVREQSKIEDAKTTINTEKNQTISKIDQEISTANAQFTSDQANRQSALIAKLSDQQKQGVAQVRQLQSQFDALTAQMKVIPIQESQARLEKYTQAIQVMQSDCNAQAVKEVAAIQTINNGRIARGELRCGTINECFALENMTDEARYDAKADERRRKCEQTTDFYRKAAIAEQAADNAVNALEAQRQSLIAQQNSLLDSINQAKAQNNLDDLTSRQMATLNDSSARQANAAKIGGLEAQKQTATDNAQQKLNAKDLEARNLQTEIAQKQDYMQEKQDLLAAVEKSSGGKDFSAADAAKITSGMSKTTGAARSGMKACKCKQDGEGADGSNCSLFADYIDKAGLGPIPWYTAPSTALANTTANGTAPTSTRTRTPSGSGSSSPSSPYNGGVYYDDGSNSNSPGATPEGI